MKTKPFKLRAFKIENPNITQTKSDVMDLLKQRLSETVANQRRMLLNQNDKDEDLICNYDDSNSKYIWGSILRISPSDEVLNIPDSLFEEEKIVLQELDNLKDQGSIIYKSHYYFLISNEYMITTLPGNTTVSRFQTYINWFLTNLRNEVYEFTPMIIDAPIYQLKNLSKISIQDPILEENKDENTEDFSTYNEKKSLSLKYLKSLFSDVISFDEAKLNEIVSADLVLKFKKPAQMTKQDYQNALAAYMKPISDVDNVTFYPKNGSPVKGTEILRVKSVDIEKLESNNISEKGLMIQMEQFLSELKYESSN